MSGLWRPEEKQKTVNTVKMKKQCVRGKDKGTCAHWVQLKKKYFEITIVNSSSENVSVFYTLRFLAINLKIWGLIISQETPSCVTATVRKRSTGRKRPILPEPRIFALGVPVSILGKSRTPEW